MHSLRMRGVTGVLLAGMLLSGCATTVITGKTDLDRAAFGRSKRFAVVSIASIKEFGGEKGFMQMFKSTDDIPGANTQPIINALEPKIIHDLARTGRFRLLSQHRVLSSWAYRHMKGDTPELRVFLMSKKLDVARHYKYISDPRKFAQLARELHVDGVIGVTMNFSITSGKGALSINGLTLGKKSYSSIATITVVAYDRSGKVIWKDSTVKEADPGDSKAIVLLDVSDMTSTHFKKMQPSAIEVGRKAVDVLVKRFDDTMAGIEVSSFQSMK